MGYQTVHYYKYGNTNDCVESYQYVPDNDALRSEITNAYKYWFGRYGEPGGLEGHYNNWLSGNATETTILELIKNGGIASGEYQTIQNNGKHTGLSTGGCPIKGCKDPRANNYNSNADIDDGSCVYNPPTASISINKSWMVNTGSQSRTISWSAGGVIDSISLTDVSNPGTSGSANVSPSSTRTYTLTVNGPKQTATDSVTLTVYQLPVIDSIICTPNPIINGGQTTLSWQTSGNITGATIDQGIGDVPTEGNVKNLAPTVSTTYGLYIYFQDPDGNIFSDSDSVRLTVYQKPTLQITLPAEVNYNEDIILEYEYEYANISATVTPQYRYRNANNDGFDNIFGSAVNLTPLSTSAEYGIAGTLVANEVTLSPIYNDDGPFSISYSIQVQGDGGTETVSQIVDINIDLTPNNITIPQTEGLKNEDPVYSPDPEKFPDTELIIEDVDIPVEIKADKPIKISLDDGNTWINVREKT